MICMIFYASFICLLKYNSGLRIEIEFAANHGQWDREVIWRSYARIVNPAYHIWRGYGIQYTLILKYEIRMW